MRIVWTALAYFLLAFVAGFALGAIRGLVVEPRVGALAAVLIEAPVIMTACWLACGAALRWFSPPATTAARLAVGGLWLALLLTAEVGVGLRARGLSLADTLATFATAPGLVGLAAQTMCASFPLVRR